MLSVASFSQDYTAFQKYDDCLVEDADADCWRLDRLVVDLYGCGGYLVCLMSKREKYTLTLSLSLSLSLSLLLRCHDDKSIRVMTWMMSCNGKCEGTEKRKKGGVRVRVDCGALRFWSKIRGLGHSISGCPQKVKTMMTGQVTTRGLKLETRPTLQIFEHNSTLKMSVL